MSDAEIRSRAFWSGTITFGLVSIPVNLFPGTRSQHLGLRMVDEDGTPLTRRYFCPQEDRMLDRDEIVRGYELDEDEYVVVTDEELEALEPRKTRDIDLRRFVPAEQLDPVFFDRPYFLTPGSESTKAYKLLAATMEKGDRAGIATFVMRGKEYLVAIFAEGGILRAETLRFHDEIRTPASVGLPARARVKAADVKKLETEIRKLASKTFSEKELADKYAGRLRKLVKQKERRHEDVYEAPGEPEDDEDSVIDLMEVLKRSLAGGGTARRPAARKNGAARKSSARKATRKRAARKSA